MTLLLYLFRSLNAGGKYLLASRRKSLNDLTGANFIGSFLVVAMICLQNCIWCSKVKVVFTN